MGRKPEPEKAANHERWLVSFADFMTLLFALFVVLFATTQNEDGPSPKELSEGIQRAFQQWGPHIFSGDNILPLSPDTRDAKPNAEEGDDGFGFNNVKNDGKPDPFALDALATPTPTPTPTPAPAGADSQQGDAQEGENLAFKRIYDDLRGRLGAQIDSNKIEIKQEKRGIIISLGEAGFFGSGSDQLKRGSRTTLDTIAEELKKMSKQRKEDLAIRIEGHTDNMPLRNDSRFVDNWGLSCFRANAVRRLMEKDYAFPSRCLITTGYGDSRPKASNSTEEGRARNRRVDIVVLNAEYAGLESSASQSVN